MRKYGHIPTLLDYQDWLIKAEHDLDDFRNSGSVYAIANCLLALNALPEWIVNSSQASSTLIALAQAKLTIMKGEGFSFDLSRIADINHQLRFIRLFCNHSKHALPKGPIAQISMCAPLPAAYPIKFGWFIVAGAMIEAESLAADAIAFWRSHVAVP